MHAQDGHVHVHVYYMYVLECMYPYSYMHVYTLNHHISNVFLMAMI